MKVVIASDIHGSEYYMNKLKECFDKENAEQLRMFKRGLTSPIAQALTLLQFLTNQVMKS